MSKEKRPLHHSPLEGRARAAKPAGAGSRGGAQTASGLSQSMPRMLPCMLSGGFDLDMG